MTEDMEGNQTAEDARRPGGFLSRREQRYVRILKSPFPEFSPGEVCDLMDKVDDPDGERVFGALYRVRKKGLDKLFFGHEVEFL